MASTHSLVCVTWTIMDLYAKTVRRKAIVNCLTVNKNCLKQFIITRTLGAKIRDNDPDNSVVVFQVTQDVEMLHAKTTPRVLTS